MPGVPLGRTASLHASSVAELGQSSSMPRSPTAGIRDALVAALDARRVSDGQSELDLHAADLTFHTPARPELVVYPESTEEVVRVLALADQHRIPVTPFGAASSLEGHVIPIRGGISLDLTRMDRVVAVRPDDLLAVVQPGVTRSALERAAGQHGLMFPVDPGADATLGGMAATNAAGTTTPRYGKMRPNVLALEAVLPGGRVIRTGSPAAKTSAGYDLTGLLVGSEGTLGVITELTLRLHGIPEHAVALRISFPAVEAASRTAVAAVAAGVGVTRLELLDELNVRAINAYSGTSYPESPCLFVEAAGTADSVEGDLALIRELAESEGATELAYEREPGARTRLWSARHNAAYSWGGLYPGRKHCSTDVCVPLSELPGAVALARRETDRLGLKAGILGHVGDGNFHVGAMLDPDDPSDIAAFEELSSVLVADALARGGTCTGEHGIGLGKLGALEREHPDLVPLMRGIKAVFDPHGIMNPGKVLRPDA
jgi:D-lactate dehydrogenase (cytochrome)